MKKLQKLLEDDYQKFESLDNIDISSYVLGFEQCTRTLMDKIVPSIIVGVWSIAVVLWQHFEYYNYYL